MNAKKGELSMTFKEFLEKYPEEVKKAKACETIGEFKKLVDEFGISYKGDAELKEAYDLVKNSQKELSDDDISAVAGGSKKNTYNSGGGSQHNS